MVELGTFSCKQSNRTLSNDSIKSSSTSVVLDFVEEVDTVSTSWLISVMIIGVYKVKEITCRAIQREKKKKDDEERLFNRHFSGRTGH